MDTLCAATGLKIIPRPEWTDKKLSSTCAMTFSVTGNNILYSAPAGNFDLQGIKNSIELKKEVKKHLAEGDGPYFQILDYAALKGSSQAVRNVFIKDLNDDNRLQALIFCNLSLPISTAVKIGKLFITPAKTTHIVNHYIDAVKLALKLCDQYHLKQDFHALDPNFRIDGSNYSRSQVVLNQDKDWDIQVSGFSNRAAIIDRCILHSVSGGYLGHEHLASVDQLRNSSQAALPPGSTLKYIVVDSSGLEGMSHRTRRQYMKSLKEWHQRFPFRMYIVYGADTFTKTMVHMARPLMSFKVEIAHDFNYALEIVRRDKRGESGERLERRLGTGSMGATPEDIEKLLAYIARLNWEETGVDRKYIVEEQHPFYVLFHSIKLIKEEFDSLLNEQQQLNESLQVRKIILRKQAKNLADYNESLVNEIAVRKKAEAELQKHRYHLEETIAERTGELQNLVNAMAGRENRMAELKKVIVKLRTQLTERGITPIADDPLKNI